MTRYGMVVKTDRCNGCYNCVIACKDEYVGNEYPPYSLPQPDTGQFWMQMKEKERGQYPYVVKVAYTPTPCMGCKDAPCIKAATDGSVYTRGDGVVIIDPVKAKGQRQLVDSCPYGVIFWNEELNVAQKCTFCAHRIEKGMIPRCAEACPTDAILFGDLDDPNSEASKLLAAGKTETMRSELGLDTAVRYTDLPKTFIAGSVYLADNDECAADALVTVTDGSETKTTKTNNYGDFEVDKLVSGKTYGLKIERPGYATISQSVTPDGDTYLGDIALKK
jgi:Fe-S-cluster-containing dehydrogenase component